MAKSIRFVRVRVCLLVCSGRRSSISGLCERRKLGANNNRSNFPTHCLWRECCGLTHHLYGQARLQAAYIAAKRRSEVWPSNQEYRDTLGPNCGR